MPCVAQANMHKRIPRITQVKTRGELCHSKSAKSNTLLYNAGQSQKNTSNDHPQDLGRRCRLRINKKRCHNSAVRYAKPRSLAKDSSRGNGIEQDFQIFADLLQSLFLRPKQKKMRGCKRKAADGELPLAKERRLSQLSQSTRLIPDIARIIFEYAPTFRGEIAWSLCVPVSDSIETADDRFVQTRNCYDESRTIYNANTGVVLYHGQDIMGTLFDTWDVYCRADSIVCRHQGERKIRFRTKPCARELHRIIVLETNSIVCFGRNGIGDLDVAYISAKALWDWLRPESSAQEQGPVIERHFPMLEYWGCSVFHSILTSRACLLFQCKAGSFVYDFEASQEYCTKKKLSFTSKFRVTSFSVLQTGEHVFVRQGRESASVVFRGKKRRLAQTKASLVVRTDATIVLCDTSNTLTCRDLASWKLLSTETLPFDVFGLYELPTLDSIVAVSQQGDTWTVNGAQRSSRRTQVESVYVCDKKRLVIERSAHANGKRLIECHH